MRDAAAAPCDQEQCSRTRPANDIGPPDRSGPRGLIQVGVNVTASSGTPGKKNRPSRQRGGPPVGRFSPSAYTGVHNLSNVTPLCFV